MARLSTQAAMLWGLVLAVGAATAAARPWIARRSLVERWDGSQGQFIETALDMDGSYKQLTGSYKMMVVSSAMMYPCRTGSLGNYFNLLNLRNKQDYADMHGYAFHWSTRQSDKELSGPWNKVALLRDLAHTYNESQVEWFLWVDNDAIFVEMERVIPFHKYDGVDFAVWSLTGDVMEELDVWSVNTGVLLLRNSDWTRTFLTEWAKVGRNWGGWDDIENELQKEIRAEIPRYAAALFDQCGLVWVLHQHRDWVPRVHWEAKEEFGFHLHYKGDLPLDKLGDSTWLHPLVLHYAGCQFCSYGSWHSGDKQGHAQTCTRHYLTVYERAFNQTAAVFNDGADLFSAEKAYRMLASELPFLRDDGGGEQQVQQQQEHHHKSH